ncbi:WAT1-related protein At5g40240-like isoform X2 [Phaseolus vulgaris]|uniref:WAT1-related protein At5g40240-like isoform X2 n=1 Tax=Phaseolus vulgaris TaxID=3885 RepID=UPI0035CA74A5
MISTNMSWLSTLLYSAQSCFFPMPCFSTGGHKVLLSISLYFADSFCLPPLGTVVAYVGIDLSSPSLLSAILNLLPAFTFVLALAFRMEEVHWRSSSSQAKVLGTIVSIAGAFVVILYKGPSIFKTHSPNFSNQMLQFSPQLNWIMGGIACVADALFTSMWYIYQASVGETYPDIDVTVIVFFQLLFSTVQCGVFALFSVRDLAEWKLKMDIGLIGILYQAIIATLLRYILCMWCIIKAGPLFCAMFQPVAIIFTVWMGAIFLGDDFTLGSLIGALVIVIGFYAVQWGKSKEEYEIAKGVQHLDSESLSHGVPLLQDSNT